MRSFMCTTLVILSLLSTTSVAGRELTELEMRIESCIIEAATTASQIENDALLNQYVLDHLRVKEVAIIAFGGFNWDNASRSVRRRMLEITRAAILEKVPGKLRKIDPRSIKPIFRGMKKIFSSYELLGTAMTKKGKGGPVGWRLPIGEDGMPLLHEDGKCMFDDLMVKGYWASGVVPIFLLKLN